MESTLKHAEIYYSGNTPYMKLVYEYADNNGTHKVTIPCMDLPCELKQIPKIRPISYSEEPCSSKYRNVLTGCKSGCCVHLDGGDAILNPCIVDTKEGPVSDACYVDELIIPKTHDMTIEEIEKKLGYPIRIVSNKKKTSNL